MADLALSVTVSRGQLALPDLNINDHVTYYVSPQFLGGQVSWNRTQVTSPFMDGAVTTFRTRQMVTEQIGVEVVATDQDVLHTALNDLVNAFSQDDFQLTVEVGSRWDVGGVTSYVYRCEAADYQVAWQGPRMLALHVQVVFNVPRQPISLNGTV